MVVKNMVPIKVILGPIRAYLRIILGDNGKEHGNYYNGLYRDYWVYGWWSKLWSLLWIPIIVRHLILR